jgi:hypothetical protein
MVNPGFWLDEAMLYDALRRESVVLPWTALSHYNQAAPYFLALTWKAMIAAFDGNEIALRLPELLAGVGGMVALWLSACRRLGSVGTGAAVLLAGLSETAVFQSAQFKHYSFEFLAAVLILLAAVRLAGAIREPRAQTRFAAFSIAALPFSYCAPIVTAACGLGALAAQATTGRFRPAEMRRLALLAALWALVTVVWQEIAVQPSTLLQFTGFARSYEARYVVLARPESWLNVKQFIAVLEPAFSSVVAGKVAALLLCVPWFAGALIGWRGRIFEHATCLALVLGTVVLSIAHVFPLAEPRKMLFVLPVFALSFGASVEDVAERFRGQVFSGGRPALALAALALVFFPFGLVHLANSQQEEVAKVLRSVPQKACPIIWAYYLAWPAVEMYGNRQPDATFIGQVSTGSGAAGWTRYNRDTFAAYLQDSANLLDSYPRVCLLFSHEQGEERADVLAALKASHACSILLEETGAKLYHCEPAAGQAPTR